MELKQTATKTAEVALSVACPTGIGATWITRQEAKIEAAAFCATVPGSRVRHNAWGVTVIAADGAHIAFWNGSKKGFYRCR